MLCSPALIIWEMINAWKSESSCSPSPPPYPFLGMTNAGTGYYSEQRLSTADSVAHYSTAIATDHCDSAQPPSDLGDLNFSGGSFSYAGILGAENTNRLSSSPGRPNSTEFSGLYSAPQEPIDPASTERQDDAAAPPFMRDTTVVRGEHVTDEAYELLSSPAGKAVACCPSPFPDPYVAPVVPEKDPGLSRFVPQATEEAHLMPSSPKEHSSTIGPVASSAPAVSAPLVSAPAVAAPVGAAVQVAATSEEAVVVSAPCSSQPLVFLSRKVERRTRPRAAPQVAVSEGSRHEPLVPYDLEVRNEEPASREWDPVEDAVRSLVQVAAEFRRHILSDSRTEIPSYHDPVVVAKLQCIVRPDISEDSSRMSSRSRLPVVTNLTPQVTSQKTTQQSVTEKVQAAEDPLSPLGRGKLVNGEVVDQYTVWFENAEARERAEGRPHDQPSTSATAATAPPADAGAVPGKDGVAAVVTDAAAAAPEPAPEHVQDPSTQQVHGGGTAPPPTSQSSVHSSVASAMPSVDATKGTSPDDGSDGFGRYGDLSLDASVHSLHIPVPGGKTNKMKRAARRAEKGAEEKTDRSADSVRTRCPPLQQPQQHRARKTKKLTCDIPVVRVAKCPPPPPNAPSRPTTRRTAVISSFPSSPDAFASDKDAVGSSCDQGGQPTAAAKQRRRRPNCDAEASGSDTVPSPDSPGQSSDARSPLPPLAPSGRNASKSSGAATPQAQEDSVVLSARDDGSRLTSAVFSPLRGLAPRTPTPPAETKGSGAYRPRQPAPRLSVFQASKKFGGGVDLRPDKERISLWTPNHVGSCSVREDSGLSMRLAQPLANAAVEAEPVVSQSSEGCVNNTSCSNTNPITAMRGGALANSSTAQSGTNGLSLMSASAVETVMVAAAGSSGTRILAVPVASEVQTSMTAPPPCLSPESPSSIRKESSPKSGAFTRCYVVQPSTASSANNEPGGLVQRPLPAFKLLSSDAQDAVKDSIGEVPPSDNHPTPPATASARLSVKELAKKFDEGSSVMCSPMAQGSPISPSGRTAGGALKVKVDPLPSAS